MNLIDSLELTDNTNEQLFDKFKDTNTVYETKKKLIIKSVEDLDVLFDLEHSRLTNLKNWYIPSHIDKLQLIFDDLSQHKFYG